MRDITIEELSGVWRSDNQHIRFDFAVRPQKISFFTVIDLRNNSIISEAQGELAIEDMPDEGTKLLKIGVAMNLVLWKMALEDDEIVVEIKDKGRYRMKKIIGNI